jgi:WhiB family redox-sensing transcriptional regulator
MTAADDERRLVAVAWQLDRLRWMPTAALDGIVRRDGLCFWAYPEGDPPDVSSANHPDRELAFQYCAGCPVQDECLELELRTAGESTVGVWGAMTEDDRRAVYPHWLQRGERADRGGSPNGGPTS